MGYTNAGKSTLFNALTKAKAYAANQLFATLDTTTRSLYLEEAGTSVSLSDTVGFIRDLPHKLVEAFKATLQEAADADLLLQVVDAASPVLTEQMEEVERVLAEIGAQHIPQILVYNKLDLLEDNQRPRQLQDWLTRVGGEHGGQRLPRIFVSAAQGEGLDELRAMVASLMQAAPVPEYAGQEPDLATAAGTSDAGDDAEDAEDAEDADGADDSEQASGLDVDEVDLNPQDPPQDRSNPQDHPQGRTG